MRKAIPIILIILSFIGEHVYAQQHAGRSDAVSIRDWEAGLDIGMTQYYGDISNKGFFEKLTANETRFGIGIFGRKHFNEYLGVGAQFQYFSLRSEKETFSDGQDADLEFTGSTYHFGLHAYLNFSNLFFGAKDRMVSVYGLAGLGYVGWQSQLWDTNLDALVWDNATIDPNTFNTGAAIMPLSLGADIRLTDQWRLNIQSSLQTIFSDHLDFYEDGFPRDMMLFTSVGVSYVINFQQKKRDASPRQTAPRRNEPIRVIDYEATSARQRTVPAASMTRELPVVSIEPTETHAGPYEFRVQVIAMSRSRIDTEAFRRQYNIETPLIENTFSGLYRYSTGRFSNFRDAEAYSRVIRAKGVHDAFVVAYRGNERIRITSDMKR